MNCHLTITNTFVQKTEVDHEDQVVTISQADPRGRFVTLVEAEQAS